MLSTCLLGLALWLAPQPAQPAQLDEDLLAAARTGDVEKVKLLLGQGANLEAKTHYGVTPLFYAASRGHAEVLKVLLDKGAKADVHDTFYKASALDFTMQNGYVETARLLVQKGAKANGATLAGAVYSDKTEMLKMLLDTAKFTPSELSAALAQAESAKKPEAAELLKKAGAQPPPPETGVPAETLALYAGNYKGDPMDLTFEVKGGHLELISPGGTLALSAKNTTTFTSAQVPNLSIEFKVENGKATAVLVTQGDRNFTLTRQESK